jgi:hypothetical protein
LADSLPLPVSILMSIAAESFFCAEQMVQERQRSYERSLALFRSPRVRPLSSVLTFALIANRSAIALGYLLMAQGFMRNSALPTMCDFGRLPLAPTLPTPNRRWFVLASMEG